MQLIPAPDFPTAGLIIDAHGMVAGLRAPAAAASCMRARTHIEDIEQRPPGDHRHRAAVPGEQGAPAREDRRAGQGKEARGHHRRCATSPTRTACASYIELKRGENAEVVLNNLYQQTADAGGVRHQHGGAGRRPAADAEPEADARGLRPPPPRSGHAPHQLRAAQGARARPRPRRPDGRAGQHRRDDRADQDLANPGEAKAGADGARPGSPGLVDAMLERAGARCVASGGPCRRVRPRRRRLPAVRSAGAARSSKCACTA